MGIVEDWHNNRIVARLDNIEAVLIRIAQAVEHLVPPVSEQQLDPETSVLIDDEDTPEKEEEPIPDGPE